jgi:raffinose/stachyose/melibiose transport system permease protein
MTVLGAVRSPASRDAAHRRRTWLTQPATYLLILVVLAIILVPMLYLILSGFRTTGQLGSNPNGLPHPWVWNNYATILTSAVFWQAVQNSAIIAVVATALA